MTHSGIFYQLDVSTFYFYEPLLFQIFFLLKFMKIYALPCLVITSTVNSHADNHFCKYIYLFQVLYRMK